MPNIETRPRDRAVINRSGGENDGKVIALRSDSDAGMAWMALVGDYEVIDFYIDTGEIITTTGIIPFQKPDIDPESM